MALNVNGTEYRFKDVMDLFTDGLVTIVAAIIANRIVPIQAETGDFQIANAVIVGGATVLAWVGMRRWRQFGA